VNRDIASRPRPMAQAKSGRVRVVDPPRFSRAVLTVTGPHVGRGNRCDDRHAPAAARSRGRASAPNRTRRRPRAGRAAHVDSTRDEPIPRPPSARHHPSRISREDLDAEPPATERGGQLPVVWGPRRQGMRRRNSVKCNRRPSPPRQCRNARSVTAAIGASPGPAGRQEGHRYA